MTTSLPIDSLLLMAKPLIKLTIYLEAPVTKQKGIQYTKIVILTNVLKKPKLLIFTLFLALF